MKGHKGRVNNIAVHPSSKLALSVGQDKTLRMWDLMRGKGAASTKLGKGIDIEQIILWCCILMTLYLEGEVVRWSGSGTWFVVQNGSGFTIHNLVRKRHSIQKACFLISGVENGAIVFYDTSISYP